MDIFHQYGLPSGRCRAAYPFAQGDLYAGGLALKGSQHQTALLHMVKTRPVDVLQRGKKQRGGVGKVGDKMRHTADQRGELPLKFRIIGHRALLSDVKQPSAVFHGDPGDLLRAEALHFCDFLRNIAQVS